MPPHVGISTPSRLKSAASSTNLDEAAELESHSRSVSVWEYAAATVIYFIVFPGGLNLFNLPGLLLLLWAALAKYCKIPNHMSDRNGKKRKYEENETTIFGSETRSQKKKRETGEYVAAGNDLEEEHPAVSPNLEIKRHKNVSSITSLTTILNGEVSNSQKSLNIAKSELEDGDVNNQALPDPIVTSQDSEAIDNTSSDHEDHDCESCASDEENEEEDELEDFRPVLSAIALENIPKLASTLRQHRDSKKDESDDEEVAAECPFINCVVNKSPVSGSFNLFFLIEFHDGVKWGLRVPAIGIADKFDQAAAQAMENEVLTIRFLKRKTNIPIPDIYAYNASLDNELNCPYIIMEFVEGTLLSKKWYDGSISDIERERVRARALQGIAGAMAQLGQFRYDLGGALLFDESGNPTGVGAMRIVDALGDLDEQYGNVYKVGYVIL